MATFSVQSKTVFFELYFLTSSSDHFQCLLWGPPPLNFFRHTIRPNYDFTPPLDILLMLLFFQIMFSSFSNYVLITKFNDGIFLI